LFITEYFFFLFLMPFQKFGLAHRLTYSLPHNTWVRDKSPHNPNSRPYLKSGVIPLLALRSNDLGMLFKLIVRKLSESKVEGLHNLTKNFVTVRYQFWNPSQFQKSPQKKMCVLSARVVRYDKSCPRIVWAAGENQ
jgi:hypothetical protein